jgi:hypothetical protein
LPGAAANETRKLAWLKTTARIAEPRPQRRR